MIENIYRNRLLTWIYDTLYLMVRRLFRHARLSTSPDQLSCNPFFIVGAARSGTTLLRGILAAHPEVSIPPELNMTSGIIKYYRFSHLNWLDLTKLILSHFGNTYNFSYWNIDVMELYAEISTLPPDHQSLAKLLDILFVHYARLNKPEALRWGEKTPLNALNIEQIDWVFPQAHYIHILRDGRDVISSMLKAGVLGDGDLQSAAKLWKKSIAKIQSFGNRIATTRYFEVRYEALVQQPEKQVQQICSFLGLTYTPEMLDFWKSAGNLGDSVLAHHRNLHNPINPNSIGKWQNELSPYQQASIVKLIQSDLMRLGYSTELWTLNQI